MVQLNHGAGVSILKKGLAIKELVGVLAKLFCQSRREIPTGQPATPSDFFVYELGASASCLLEVTTQTRIRCLPGRRC